MFSKILIANRGEIAVRIARACREMQIASVAVYSDVDRTSLHVLRADEAVEIGAASAAESYLHIEKIIAAAKRCGADAIHPGYGFLSENADFAQACAEQAIKFIGPNASAMRVMGSKTGARKAMEKAGVPLTPGTTSGLTGVDMAAEAADRIGYPVMLKAAAGGGGKGMRVVNRREELNSALEAAQSEALRSFGDDEVYVEKLILNPRHIEVQIIADETGHTLHLGERECSIQRRQQKVVEESPSSFADAQLRKSLGEAAVQAAKAAGYSNAGTVEFLVDEEKNFYFLEMNTRLQVEHPVTELVTGLDLVQLQIRIAAGERLWFGQEDVHLRGHAIECRLYAEDPDNNYFPSPGKIMTLALPAGPGVRWDGGIYEGWTVPVDYDPLLAKLIAYGGTRQQAIARLQGALDECFVGGITTNLALLRRIAGDRAFVTGEVNTDFLNRLAKHEQSDQLATAEVAAIAAGLFAMLEKESKEDAVPGSGANGIISSGWKRATRAEMLRD